MSAINRPNWTGHIAFCIGSGPSLTVADCELVRASGHHAVVTNTTFRMCPWADAVFAFDSKWWKVYHEEVFATFAGHKVSSAQVAGKYGVEIIPRRHRNSGAGAIGLAMDYGASKVVLLGYDMQKGPNGESHHHGDHPPELDNATSIGDWHRHFERIAAEATRRCVEVVNASRRTAIRYFPKVELEAIL